MSSLDFRVAKAFKIKRTTLNIDFDIFNLFNAARCSAASTTTG